MDNKKIDLKCSLETRTKKSGGTYEVAIIKITDSVEKMVFLDQAELELIKMSSSKSSLPFGK